MIAARLLPPTDESRLRTHQNCRRPGTWEAALSVPLRCRLPKPLRRAQAPPLAERRRPQRADATSSCRPLLMPRYLHSFRKSPSCKEGDPVPQAPRDRRLSGRTRARFRIPGTASSVSDSCLRLAWLHRSPASRDGRSRSGNQSRPNHHRDCAALQPGDFATPALGNQSRLRRTANLRQPS